MFKNNLVHKSISRIFKLLPNSYKRKSIFQLILMIINSFVDLLGLAAVIPLLAALLKEGFIHQQKQLDWLYQTMGFSEDKWFVVFICACVILIIIIKNIFGLWVNQRQMLYSGEVYECLSSKMFWNTYQKGLLYFNNENSNKIQNSIVRIPQNLTIMMNTGIFQFLNEIIVMFLIIISITIYDPKIIVVLILTIVPVFMVFYRFNAAFIKKTSREINDLMPQITKPVYEMSFGYVDVAISGVFNSFQSLFSQKINEIKIKQTKMSLLNVIPLRLVEITVIGTVIIILLYGVFVLQSVESIITLLGVFGLAAYRIVPSANRLMMAVINMKSYEYTLDSIERVISENKDVNLLHKLDEIQFLDTINITDLSFRFPDATEALLDKISVEIKKGEVIGIIGRSGSGKTTLMNILLGFVQPTYGSIKIDGKELTKENINAWQNLLGYVRQDVFLIDGSIAENVAFGVKKEDIDYSKLHETLKIASLKDFIEELPEGVDTNIGERGSKVSGGQRQRIGIARALYHGAEVLFFDEATSALDEKTEQEITEAIESLNQYNLTMVIIAHRLSSLKYCDKIYRVEDGGIFLE